MEKFGVFKLIGSLFNSFYNKNSADNVSENSSNGKVGLGDLLFSLFEKPNNETLSQNKFSNTYNSLQKNNGGTSAAVKNNFDTVNHAKIPLQNSMLSVMSRHDQTVKRIKGRDKTD